MRLHPVRGVVDHVDARRETDASLDLACGRFVRGGVLESLNKNEQRTKAGVDGTTNLELEAKHRRELPNAQSFTCLRSTIRTDSVRLSATRHTLDAFEHLLHVYMVPSFSGCVYLSKKDVRLRRIPPRQKTHFLKHDSRVTSWPAAEPLPLTSKLISNIGSGVELTFPHRSHLTSLCSVPSNVECTMQMQEAAVFPLDVW